MGAFLQEDPANERNIQELLDAIVAEATDEARMQHIFAELDKEIQQGVKTEDYAAYVQQLDEVGRQAFIGRPLETQLVEVANWRDRQAEQAAATDSEPEAA